MNKIKINLTYQDVSVWPHPAEYEIPEEARRRFHAVKLALTLYAQGVPVENVFRATGIKPPGLRRFMRRAIAVNPETGVINGFYVALPYFRAFQRPPRKLDSLAIALKRGLQRQR